SRLLGCIRGAVRQDPRSWRSGALAAQTPRGLIGRPAGAMFRSGLIPAHLRMAALPPCSSTWRMASVLQERSTMIFRKHQRRNDELEAEAGRYKAILASISRATAIVELGLDVTILDAIDLFCVTIG